MYFLRFPHTCALTFAAHCDQVSVRVRKPNHFLRFLGCRSLGLDCPHGLFLYYYFVSPVLQLLLRFGDTQGMTQLSIAQSNPILSDVVFFSLSALHCPTLFWFRCSISVCRSISQFSGAGEMPLFFVIYVPGICGTHGYIGFAIIRSHLRYLAKYCTV